MQVCAPFSSLHLSLTSFILCALHLLFSLYLLSILLDKDGFN